MSTIRYQLDSHASQLISGKLLYVTHSRFENDWPSLMHIHHFAELLYVKKGRGYFYASGEKQLLQKEDFVIINPYAEHTEESIGDEPLEYIILGVEGLRFSFDDHKDFLCFNCKNSHKDFMHYMDIMLNEMEEKGQSYEFVCQNLVEVLIVKLLRITDFAFDVENTPKASKECARIKHHLDTKFTEHITLETLASLTHLNKYYLAHSFQKYYGVSPINYLCQVRIKASKELLTSTNHSITQIAQTCGFSSLSYFSQCFYKYCGISARVYRSENSETTCRS